MQNLSPQSNGNRICFLKRFLGDSKGKSGGGRNWEVGIGIYTLLILCIK